MDLGNNSLAAFATSAGIAPDKISLLIRTILLVITLLWSAWCVYGELQFFKYHDTDVIDMIRKLSRILLIVSLMVSLVIMA